MLQSAYNTSEKRNKFNEALEREKQNFKYKNPILPGHNPLIKLSSKVYFQTIKKTEWKVTFDTSEQIQDPENSCKYTTQYLKPL